MRKADSFRQPMNYGGTYPNNWAGYVHLQPRTAEGKPNLRHLGDDYNGPGAGNSDIGMDVFCVANGVVEATIFWNGTTAGFGNHIFVRHELTEELYQAMKREYGIDSRIIYSHYAHLKSINCTVGQEVNKGDVIAKVGNSGTVYGHLHNELRKATGLGYESYPSGNSVEWINQYYFTPFRTYERFKDPISPPVTPAPTTPAPTTPAPTTPAPTTESTSSSSTSSSSSSTTTTPPVIPPPIEPPPDVPVPLPPTPIPPVIVPKPNLLQMIIDILKAIFGWIKKV